MHWPLALSGKTLLEVAYELTAVEPLEGYDISEIRVAKEEGRVQVLGSKSGRSVAWLARVVRVHEVVSSNLTAPTIFPSGNLVPFDSWYYVLQPAIRRELREASGKSKAYYAHRLDPRFDKDRPCSAGKRQRFATCPS